MKQVAVANCTAVDAIARCAVNLEFPFDKKGEGMLGLALRVQARPITWVHYNPTPSKSKAVCCRGVGWV
ncbi:hypothetical protein, partial [Aerosakkonema sp. BLCC-F183]|uniref:hypothetical protein n=1 Tax=Aerosakkonema sp. BLCC-F183 TaxID=3342834 RepID=UPI0035BC0D11